MCGTVREGGKEYGGPGDRHIVLYGGRERGAEKEKGESPVLMCQNLCATLVLTS